MSSRPLRADEAQADADKAVGDLLAADADTTPDIRHTKWRNRLIGGDPDAVAAANTRTSIQMLLRVNRDLANHLAQLAADAGQPRDAYLRHLLAHHVAARTGVDPEPLLDNGRRR